VINPARGFLTESNGARPLWSDRRKPFVFRAPARLATLAFLVSRILRQNN
jgi:hypothetical protein